LRGGFLLSAESSSRTGRVPAVGRRAWWPSARVPASAELPTRQQPGGGVVTGLRRTSRRTRWPGGQVGGSGRCGPGWSAGIGLHARGPHHPGRAGFRVWSTGRRTHTPCSACSPELPGPCCPASRRRAGAGSGRVAARRGTGWSRLAGEAFSEPTTAERLSVPLVGVLTRLHQGHQVDERGRCSICWPRPHRWWRPCPRRALCTVHTAFAFHLPLIHQTSRGYPRAVNNLAVRPYLTSFLASGCRPGPYSAPSFAAKSSFTPGSGIGPPRSSGRVPE